MNLDLRGFLPEAEKIIFDGGEFEITPSIPVEFIFKFSELQAFDGTTLTAEGYEKVKDAMKYVLYLKNDKAKVDKFFDELDFASFLKVVTHISNFLTKIAEGTKKKT